MMKRALAALLLLPTLTFADEYKVGDLVVDHPVARETPTAARAGAGYLTITNTGDTADRLIAVEADFPRVEIHDVKVENDIASMFRLEDGVEIAPGASITLQPGQKHVMFMGLDGDPFEAGEEIAATLVFETAGSIDVVFQVQNAADLAETLGVDAGHGGHGDHSNHGGEKDAHADHDKDDKEHSHNH